MEEVVEVAVGQAVAGVGPLEDGLPAVGEEGVDAAVRESDSTVSTKAWDRGRVPGEVTRANLAEGAVDEVDEVLLRDGAAALRPGAVADDAGVDLYACQQSVFGCTRNHQRTL